MSYFGVTPTEIAFNVAVHIIGIVAFALIIRLISKYQGPDMKTWRILFYAMVVFIVKKIVGGLAGTGIIYIPSTLFNVIIASMFIYALFVEIDYRKSQAGMDDLNKINTTLKRINEKL